MDEEAFYKVWVDRVGVPKEELDTLVLFYKECRLSGYPIELDHPHVYSDGTVRYLPKRFRWTRRALYSFEAGIGLEYDWRNKQRRWVFSPLSGRRSSYKRLETALDIITDHLRLFDSGG